MADRAVDFREAPELRSPAPEEQILFEVRPVLRVHAIGILLGILLIPFFLIGLPVLFSIWYRVYSKKYRLTTQRLFIERGLIARQIDEVELFRLKDVTVSQGILQRIFRAGAVTVISTDDTNPRVVLQNIGCPVEIKEHIRKAGGEARRREGVRTAEFIHS